MRTTWLVTAAAAAVLATTAFAAAQGANEHDNKTAPLAQSNDARKIGGALKMEHSDHSRGNAGTETTGQSSPEPQLNTDHKDSARQRLPTANKDAEGHSSGTPNTAFQSEHKNKSGSAAENEHNHEKADGSHDAAKRESQTTGSAPAAEVKLTKSQRTKIHHVVIEEHKIPRVSHVNFSIKVGVAIPHSVHLYRVPAELIDIHPAWRRYRIIVVEDEVVLIDPATYEIVYLIPG